MRAIVISCSNVKKKFPSPKPALYVYDGPYYKTIRKLIRENSFPADVKILIVSAKYGLLELESKIETYDFRIDKHRAVEICPSVINKLEDFIRKNYCSELVINLGTDYLPAISGIENLVPEWCKVRYFNGTIIQRRQKLKEYLLNGMYTQP